METKIIARGIKYEVQNLPCVAVFIREAEQVLKLPIMFNKYCWRFEVPVMVTMKLTAVRDVTPRLTVKVYRHISHFYQITRHHIIADSNNHKAQYQAKSNWTLCNYRKLQFYCSILSLDFVSLVAYLRLGQVTMKRETEIALDKLMANHEVCGSLYDILKVFCQLHILRV
jgi:hypothetical protein